MKKCTSSDKDGFRTFSKSNGQSKTFNNAPTTTFDNSTKSNDNSTISNENSRYSDSCRPESDIDEWIQTVKVTMLYNTAHYYENDFTKSLRLNFVHD